MKEALQKLQPQTLEDLHNIISLQVLEHGHTHLEMQDGQIIRLYVPHRSLASHFQLQENN